RQLRGRSARQGDPGSSRFYLSLEDDLMRLFGSDRIARVMERIGMKEGEELVHPLLTRSIETAQKRVEQRNFAIRKHTLEYDDVMNKQREVIYDFRKDILSTENPKGMVMDLIGETVGEKIPLYIPEGAHRDEWDLDGLLRWLNFTFPVFLKAADFEKEESGAEEVKAAIMDALTLAYERKGKFEDDSARSAGRAGEGVDSAMQRLARVLMLSVVDRLWKEHLYNMDALREGIFLRAYGQKDPLVEYKREGFDMFAEMMANVKDEIATGIFRITFSPEAMRKIVQEPVEQQYVHKEVSAFRMAKEEEPALTGVGASVARANSAQMGEGEQPVKKPFVRKEKKVGPNEPCPCGSGRKHKKCCGQT
ncbi:MAG: SEC-C metal-binding domain-containing protein, partial [bacterium]